MIAGLTGHYTRLYEITPDGVCVQDRGNGIAAKCASRAEARAMGDVWVNLVISS